MGNNTWIRVKLVWLLFLTLLLTVARFTPVQAAINWQINGPEGGQVNCFVSPDATGTVIFAGLQRRRLQEHRCRRALASPCPTARPW